MTCGAGEAIWFDDGKIGGVIEKVEDGAGPSSASPRTCLRAVKLRADKGINLPDSALRLAAMTDKDIEDLSFVARHADIVELVLRQQRPGRGCASSAPGEPGEPAARHRAQDRNAARLREPARTCC